VAFDDQRAVAAAGLLLPATLAGRLGIERLVNETVDLGGRAGGALPGRKVLALVDGMLADADSIDDMGVLRSGRTEVVLGHRVMAPSTLGTFLRAHTFGHVRQLDRVLGVALERAWAAGAGPGDRRLVIDIDSLVGEVHGYQSRAPPTVTPSSLATTRCWQPARGAARCSTSAAARDRPTPSAAPGASSRS